MRLRWLLAALVLSAVLASLQWWAVTDFLYWRYDWFDNLMHFLGGITLGAFSVAFFVTRGTARYVVLLALVFLGWEVFEYLFGIPRESNYLLDTVVDLTMDTLGALAVYVIARKSIWR